MFTSPRGIWDQPLCIRVWQDLENSLWIHVFPTIPLTMRLWSQSSHPFIEASWKGSRRKDIWETKQFSIWNQLSLIIERGQKIVKTKKQTKKTSHIRHSEMTWRGNLRGFTRPSLLGRCGDHGGGWGRSQKNKTRHQVMTSSKISNSKYEFSTKSKVSLLFVHCPHYNHQFDPIISNACGKRWLFKLNTHLMAINSYGHSQY